MLHVAGGVALAPQLLTAAGPEAGAPLIDGDGEAFPVHVGQRQNFLGVVILYNGGNQTLFVKFQFHDGFLPLS